MNKNLKPNSKPKVKTFGCRLNFLESNLIEKHLEESALENVTVVNTCAVTNEAERQAKQFIRKAYKENPDSNIIVTGCASQINPENWIKMKEVTKIIGNSEKLDLSSWRPKETNKIEFSNIMNQTKAKNIYHQGYENRQRAFLQIQQGCDHRCTFCIIPFGRGNNRSIPSDQIIENAKNLTNFGHKEIVLTGVDIASWGKDLDGHKGLGYLVKLIIKNVKNLERLRLSSVDPAEIDSELIDAFSNEKKLMPHLHLSIQHGNDIILKRMKRRHLYRDVIDLFNEVKYSRPDIVLGADFIAGFPTENDRAHKDSLELIEEAEICWGHIFPYSSKVGTVAAKMPQLNKKIRQLRARQLREKCYDNLKKWLKKQIGVKTNVLMESSHSGRTEHFASVRLTNGQIPGNIKKIKIIDIEEPYLIGETIND